MNLVVMGSGPAGIFAAEAIRRKDRESPVTIITADQHLAQSPVMLSYWIAANASRETLFFRNPSWFEKKAIGVRPCSRAASLKPGSRQLVLTDGQEIGYDRLLIATGASPISLPIPGIESKGVASLRTLQDAEMILGEGAGVKDVVIIGGGFIGLKLACHVKERGMGVTVLEKEPRLAVRMFDMKASRVVEKKLRQNGIGVETGVEVTGVLSEKGWVTGAKMKDGSILPCQRIVQAVGVRPNTQWLAGSGIELKGGIVVNERMETSLPGVYAAGDVTMTIDSITSEWVNNATWSSATRQGAVAGTNMAGGCVTYVHNFAVNALNLSGLKVMAAGHACHDKDEGGDIFSESGEEVYRKIVIKEGRLIGFILIGDVSGAGLLLTRMKRRDRITPELRNSLFSSASFRRDLPPNLGFRHGLLFDRALGRWDRGPHSTKSS